MSKKSRRSKRTPFAKRKEPGTAQVTAAQSTKTLPYRCSECGLTELPSGQAAPSHDLPLLAQLNEQRLWQRCPDEGPHKLHLWDPQTPSIQRLRFLLREGKRQGRLCTRVVKSSPVNLGAAAYGPACPPRRMLGEAFVERLIAESGFRKEFDLLPLRPLFKGIESDRDYPIAVGSINGWCMLPSQLPEVREWLIDIQNWEVPLVIPDMNKVAEIAATLLAARVPRAQDTSESHTATINVPFDLRFSIEEQWFEKKEVLLEIQALAQTMCKRKGPSKRPDYAVWKRRFKCYLLNRYGGLHPRQIAAIVYSGQRGGETNVRKHLQITRSILDEHSMRE